MADISKIKLPDNSEYEIKDAKARMVILKYGISTWQDFLTAYQNNCVVYCRASSNSNPATGSQTRMAFMAYVSDARNPTNVEFQYYRSVNKHTDSQQGNQVYVYKLTNANKWTVTVRNTFSKVIAGDNLTSSFVESETNSSITLSANYDTAVTQDSTKLITSGAVYTAIANQSVPDLADLPDVNITTPSNGDVLTYDSTNDEWVNGQGGGGSATLAGLDDVDISSPTEGQVLKYDSTNSEWINGTVSNVSSLDDLTNVTITTPTDGQILKYDGTNQAWVNASGGGGSSDPHITLTQAEYDALVQAGTVDPTAFYFISDASVPTGITDTIKQSLLACFSNVAWTCPIEDTQTYYNDLRESLYPGATLTSITCVYTQTHSVYPSSSLDELKQDLVVTAHYSDSSSDEITYYTLSGTLTTGTRTITVDYLGNTTTFNVTVDMTYLYIWDFTQSLVDKVQGVSANLRAASGVALPVRTSNGVELTAATQRITFLNNFTFAGKTIEFDIASMVFAGSKSYHIRMLMFGISNYSSACGPLIWRSGIGWATYNRGWTDVWSGLGGTSDEIINYMSGKTVKLVFNSDARNVTLYIDDTLIETKSLSNPYSNMRYLYFGGDGDGADSGDQCYNVTLSGLRIYENE